MGIKTYTKISIMAFILGSLVLVFGASIYLLNHGVGNDYTNTTGTIISISEYGRGRVATTIRYKVGDKPFTTLLDYYDNTMSVGDKVNISYNNMNPSNIRYVDKHTNLYIGLIIIGACLIGVSIILKLKSITSKGILKNQVILIGRVKEVIKTLDKIGVYYAIIEVENPLNHKVIEIKSKQSKCIEYRVGQEVKIQFDVKTNNMSII